MQLAVRPAASGEPACQCCGAGCRTVAIVSRAPVCMDCAADRRITLSGALVRAAARLKPVAAGSGLSSASRMASAGRAHPELYSEGTWS